MPVGIGRRGLAQHRIVKHSIGAQYSVENLQTPYNFPPGSYVFTIPRSGYWLFIAWSAGSGLGSTNAGCSGAYGEITKALLAGQTVDVKVGPEDGTSATNTILTFPDGTVATAVNAAADTPGTASGFDFSLSGSLGGAIGTSAGGGQGAGTGGAPGGVGSGPNAGGAGAPARLPFRGGRGGGFRSGIGNWFRGASPGGGGSVDGTVDGDVPGGGLVLTYLVRE